MATPEQGVVVGIFEDRRAVVRAIDALLKIGFTDEQLGFAASSDQVKDANNSTPGGHSAITRGIVGGVLGAADMLLVPFTGPTDANAILNTVLPVTEEAMDNLPYPGSHHQSQPVRPDAAMTMPEHPSTTPVVEQTPSHPHHVASEEEQERTSIVTGGVIGGIFGAAAALLIPGIGPAIAGGILVAILGGSAIGGVAGGFLGLGISKEQAQHYEQAIKAGHTLLTVKTTDRQPAVIDILREYGAHDIQAH